MVRITFLFVILRAAELMVKSGPNVTLKISKQGAIYHGLATLLNQPSPMVTKGMLIRAPLFFRAYNLFFKRQMSGSSVK